MDILFQILFWTSVAAIFHSYVLFPVILNILARKKNENEHIYDIYDDLPFISIIMSLYNEEEVIAEKLETIFNSNYPPDKLEIIIGSDNSSDNTNRIVNEIKAKRTNLYFTEFKTRQGKPGVINKLYSHANGQILILTDANVMFEKDTIFELVKHFKNNDIGLTDSRMINTKESINRKGISVQESSYISREVKIKRNESIIWGAMMGPFGGCYAIRKELYTEVPNNFLVDDFFINMSVLEKGKKAINNIKAVVYEDVSNNLKEEFRRKVRISTGNFQNLFTFSKLLFGKKGISFCFFSHKVLRWIGPFFLAVVLFSNIMLFNIDFYKYSLILFLSTVLFIFLDFLLKALKINIPVIRYFTHFFSMNLALLYGFFKFMIGVKNGIWEPTKRNQTKQ